MSAVEIDALAGVNDFARDRWGRPLITPAKGGKPVPYQRASSASKPIEDTFNLEQWHRRNVAYGIASDSSLVARMIAVGGTPQTWTADDKKIVNQIVEAANVAAKAHAAADIGTALHALVEKINQGVDPGDAGIYAADLDAYRAAIADTGWVIEPGLVEVRMVCDELKMAGTCDLLVWDAEDDCYYVADLKTGSSVEYATLSHAAQIATYANSQLYDVATGQRRSLPINTDVGYVIHLPAGQGRCDIYELNLAAGLKAARLANEVREVRVAAKKWSKPLTSSVAVEDDEILSRTDREYNLRDRVQALVAAGHADKLVWRWPENVPTFKSTHMFTGDQLDRIEQAITRAEADGDMPFNPTATPPVEPAAPVDTPTRIVVDEGDELSDDEFNALGVRFSGLDYGDRDELKQLAGEAAAAGYPISIGQRRSRRRALLTEALITWTRLECDTDLLRAVLAQVSGDTTVKNVDVPAGSILGRLTIDQAAHLGQILTGLADDTVVAHITDDGGIEFHPETSSRKAQA